MLKHDGTKMVQKTYKDWLKSSIHPGGSMFNTLTCLACHKEEILNMP